MEIEKEVVKSNTIDLPQILNSVLDTGLRLALPDFLEEDVIEIKNAFINEGFAEGVQEILDKVEDITKSLTGLFSGNFENVEQIKRLIQKDGIIDGISNLIDTLSNSLYNNNVFSKDTYNVIKAGKKTILSTLESNLENMYQETTYSIEKLDKYCEEWKENLEKENYKGMESTRKKIENKLESSKIVEQTINKARNIVKLQEYIDKKGSIENLSESEKKLLEKLN